MPWKQSIFSLTEVCYAVQCDMYSIDLQWQCKSMDALYNWDNYTIHPLHAGKKIIKSIKEFSERIKHCIDLIIAYTSANKSCKMLEGELSGMFKTENKWT